MPRGTKGSAGRLAMPLATVVLLRELSVLTAVCGLGPLGLLLLDLKSFTGRGAGLSLAGWGFGGTGLA